MRATCVLTCALALSILQHAGRHVAAADEDFRGAWRNRLDEHVAVGYHARGEWQMRIAEGAQEQVQKGTVQIEARLRCNARKFRFDLRPVGARGGGLYILDGEGFHSCAQTSAWDWTVVSSRETNAESDWPFCYPFLLAHGVVPLPPLTAPRFVRASAASGAGAPSVAGKQARFTFEDERLAVTVLHGAHGLIERYQVAKSGKKLLDLANRYRRENGPPQLESFAVVVFRDSGGVARRLDAKVTAADFSITLPMDDFAIPLPADETRASVLELLDKSVRLQPVMSIDGLAQAIQAQFGKDLQVRVDWEAFERRPEVKPDALHFDAGEATLSDLLLYRLRNNLVDFCVEPHGVVLIPRNEAWSYAAPVHYSAEDYGIDVAELRDLVYSAAALDDWADVGGRAQIVSGENEQGILVIHTQSDQVRFLQRLGELPKVEGKK